MDLSQTQQILGIVLSIVAILGIPIGVYKFYTRDKEHDGLKVEKIRENESALNNKIDVMDTKISGKLDNLHNEMNLKFEKFNEVLTAIKQNDLHSIYEKMRDHDQEMNKFRVTIEKMGTIIEERVPRKTVDQVS